MQTIFDTLDTKPQKKPAKGGTVFDLVEDSAAPALTQAKFDDVASGGSKTFQAPTPGKSYEGGWESPREGGWDDATNLFSDPIGASRSAKDEAFAQADEQYRGIPGAFDPATTKIGKAIEVNPLTRYPYRLTKAAIQTGLANLTAATAPLAPVFRPAENVARTLASVPVYDEQSAPPTREQLREDRARLEQNIGQVGVIAGSERPTTGNTVFDLVADVAAGAVPLPIPVRFLTKLLAKAPKGAKAAEAVKAVEAAIPDKIGPQGVPKETRSPLPPATTIAKTEAAAPPAPQAEMPPVKAGNPSVFDSKTLFQDIAKAREEAGMPPTHIEPEAKPMFDEAVEMRLREIEEIFSSELGGLSGKAKVAVGPHGEPVDTPGNFGKIRVKSAIHTPEVYNFKETPGRIAEAIRKDKNNPLYLRTKEAVEQGVLERHADDIHAMNEQAVERRAIQGEGAADDDISFGGFDEAQGTSGAYVKRQPGGLFDRPPVINIRKQGVLTKAEFDAMYDEAMARKKAPTPEELARRKHTDEFLARQPKDVERTQFPEARDKPQPVSATADQFADIETGRRAQVARETAERVIAGKGTWKDKRKQLGLPIAEVPISKPEIESVVKQALATAKESDKAPTPRQSLFGSTGGRVTTNPPGAVPPPPQPPARPPSAPPPVPGKDLAEVERITQAEAPKPTMMERIKAFGRTAPGKAQTSLVSEFTPARTLERDVMKIAGKPVPKVDLARKLEQVAGAPAKAEADFIEFREAVVDPIKEHANDFISYLFLRRTGDRLKNNPTVKKVGDWTVGDTARVLDELRTKVGDPVWARLEAAGQVFQRFMNRALELQVKAGRLSREVFEKIKASNDFYAPFKVMKYFDDAETAAPGTGRNIANTQDLTHVITGIDEEDLKIGNILQASAEQIVRSRILAEKNLKMLELDKLVDAGTDLIKRAQPDRYYLIEYKPAEEILHQLGLQQTARTHQPIEQQMIKVGKAIQYADEVGLKVRQKNLPSSLGRATIGGAATKGRVSLKAFTSEVIAHELGHSFDVEIGRKIKKVFGQDKDVPVRLSSAINEPKPIDPKTGKVKFGGQNEFQKELSKVTDYTGLGGSSKYKGSAVERFAEFIQLYIHDPAKARSLAPTWTDHFETAILPKQKIRELVEKLSKFYQKVDKLPNIMTPLKDMDDSNYLALAIRRAFPNKAPQVGFAKGTQPAAGNEIVVYFKNGKKTAIEVSKDVATAIQGLNAAETGLFVTYLGRFREPFRWGATGANLGFQSVNLLIRDPGRFLLMSKYGLRSPTDAYRLPIEWGHSFFTAMKGEFGKPNTLFMDYLKSGIPTSIIQRELTPGAFKKTLGLPESKDIGAILRVPDRTVLNTIAKVSAAFEDTTKLLAFKRGRRFEKLDKSSPEEALAKMEEIVTEVRNYGGSPDFPRGGRDVSKSLNYIFMFFKARMAGTSADLARLAFKGGDNKASAAAWARLGAIGIPITGLALVNQSEKYREDYDKVPAEERRRYFMIPRESFFTNDRGEQVRDYYRFPKFEIVQLWGNLIESAVDFAAKRDPKAFARFAWSATENLSPVNISGKTVGESAESVVGSVNPLLKVPAEQIFNRDTFRHRAIEPQYMEKAPPAERYRHTTPDVFVKAGQAIGVSPLRVENIVSGLTGGGLNQFAIGKPEVGRSQLTKFPVLKRFVRSGAIEGEDDQAAVTAAESKETAEQVRRLREALKTMGEWRKQNLSPDARRQKIGEIRKSDPKLADKVADLNKEERLGITYIDKQALALGVESGARAEFIEAQLGKMKSEPARQLYLQELRKKKVLTPEVARQLRMRKIAAN